MTILNKKFAAVIIVIFQCLVVITAEIRSLDGQSNNLNDPKAGTPQSEYKREIEKTSWLDADTMVSTPGEYTENVPKANSNCKAPLPEGKFPLPRCVSNLVNGLQAKLSDGFDLSGQEAKQSQRKNSHMVRWCGAVICINFKF